MSVHALAQHFDLYLCVTMQKLLPDALVIEKKKKPNPRSCSFEIKCRVLLIKEL